MKQLTDGRAWALMLLAGLVMAAGFATHVAAQRTDEKKQRTTRLPAHYANVVTEAQRSEIYAIQEQFGPRLAKARTELKAAVGERDAAIEKVLNPQQRKEVERLRAAAAERRREAFSKTTGATAPSSAESNAKVKGKKAA